MVIVPHKELQAAGRDYQYFAGERNLASNHRVPVSLYFPARTKDKQPYLERKRIRRDERCLCRIQAAMEEKQFRLLRAKFCQRPRRHIVLLTAYGLNGQCCRIW